MGLAENDPETKARLARFRKRNRKAWMVGGPQCPHRIRFAPAGADSVDARQRADRPATRCDLSHILLQVAGALQRETRAIPIVFVNVSDPIGAGFIASLARPGGNLTGVLHYEAGIVGKWLAMLKEIAPRLGARCSGGRPAKSRL